LQCGCLVFLPAERLHRLHANLYQVADTFSVHRETRVCKKLACTLDVSDPVAIRRSLWKSSRKELVLLLTLLLTRTEDWKELLLRHATWACWVVHCPPAPLFSVFRCLPLYSPATSESDAAPGEQPAERAVAACGERARDAARLWFEEYVTVGEARWRSAAQRAREQVDVISHIVFMSSSSAGE